MCSIQFYFHLEIMKTFGSSGIPEELVNDPVLKDIISQRLPGNYDFEIYKTIWRLRKARSRKVALQFPEGLLMYSCIISDILERFADVETVIMGDVTYGACCVDDFSARALGVDFLVHYGHSCLVPLSQCGIEMLYVFVHIDFDVEHFVATLKKNLPRNTRLLLSGTVQFIRGIQLTKECLSNYFREISIPQSKPLSRGEVLGCTAPSLSTSDQTIVFIADGRFHLEALMISNPGCITYKYNPYDKSFSIEKYDHYAMHSDRKSAIEKAKGAAKFGIILGTLGRQGNSDILRRLQKMLDDRGICYVFVLLSEIFPEKLELLKGVDA